MQKLLLALFLAPLALLATPLAPSDLNLTAGSGSVTISWSDNADNEIGYKIFRDGVLIHTTEADVVTYIDTGLEFNHTYTYTVKATDNTVEQIVYEDAEDNTTAGWSIYDETPAGATIQSVYDSEKKSQVIQLTRGAGEGSNGFVFGDFAGGNNALHEEVRKIITFNMNFSSAYRFYVAVQTIQGDRLLTYSQKNTDDGLNARGDIIHHGIDRGFSDGKWHLFSRDLEADLQHYEAGNSIISVDGLLIRGEGKIDDIILSEERAILPSTMYEDAEDGQSAEWRIIQDPGKYAEIRYTAPSFNGSNACLDFEATGGAVQNIYALPVTNAAQRVLEVEVGGFKDIKKAHFLLGARVKTLLGERTMYWDSWNNHEGYAARKEVEEDSNNVFLIYPSPIEHVRGWGYAPEDQVETFRVDFDAALKQLEPDNRILNIRTFITGGGYLDNIRFSSTF